MKKFLIAILLMTFIAFAISPVFAAGIRIDPHGSYYGEAVMLTSPATFNVYLQNGEGNDPHLFLAMPESSYPATVTVEWSGAGSPVAVTSWTLETDGGKIPPGCVSGSDYTVASVKSHLVTTENIYWAFVAFLDGPITETPTEFTVTVSSSNPIRLLLYVLAKDDGETLFSNSVPPTQPGFVVPEVATILLATASISALSLYALKRKNK